jgi:signal transduction histidine kinase
MTSKMHKEGRQIRFQFLSLLSHELKAPLTAVEGYLRMMKNKEAGDDIGQYEKMISRSLHRIDGMRNMIMDMLDLTRLESGNKQRNLENSDIVAITKDAIATMQPFAIQKDVNIELSSPDSLWFNSDPEEIEIILNNLISNGIKYNKPNGFVKITLTDDKHNFFIIVEDSGIGIAKDDQKKLFQEFVRIKNDKTRKIAGSGLGLSIVKRITDYYQAEITLSSEINKGSKFYISFKK